MVDIGFREDIEGLAGGSSGGTEGAGAEEPKEVREEDAAFDCDARGVRVLALEEGDKMGRGGKGVWETWGSGMLPDYEEAAAEGVEGVLGDCSVLGWLNCVGESVCIRTDAH